MESQFIAKQNLIKDLDATKRKVFIEKVKVHKKEIAFGAAIVISVVVAVIVARNKTSFKSVMKASGVEEILTNSVETRNNAVPLIAESVENRVTCSLPNSSIINVREHVRNLPEGWHPSIRKVELAAKYGYSLEEHQTYVNAYTKAA